MQRYRFITEYLGTHFNGWQKQPKGTTIQQTIEEAFSQCTRRDVQIVGSGRTDAGVHAVGQVAHFDFEGELDVEAVAKSVNALTPKGLAVHFLEPCSSDFHARYSALKRKYCYSIVLRRSVFDENRAWYVYQPLDLAKFEKELESIIGGHDFNSFSIPRNDGRSTICSVNVAALQSEGHKVLIYLEADRFLHKMVRSLVGACFDVARGHHPPGLVERILTGEFTGERTWAPPHGLCLLRVEYPDYQSL